MNICIFGTSFLPSVGGKEYVMHNLGNALSNLGHDVTVIAKRVSWEKLSLQCYYDLHRYSFPVRGGGKSGLDYLTAMLTVSILNFYKPIDVLNCHGVDYAGRMSRHLRDIYKFPLVMTPHGIDVQRISKINYGLRLDPAWEKIIVKNLKSADYVTAISKSVHNELDMIPEEKIVDIPNGVDVAKFQGLTARYLHKLLDIPGNKKIILSVGRNHIKKGYDYGIEAVSILAGKLKYKNFHYVIVGRGVTEHSKIVAKYQAGEFVSLVEEISPDKIVECYKSADVFFSPSIVEGLSLVSIEAIAAGLPLVVTNVPGNDDVVRDNSCGVIVKSQDAESMAVGLHQLLSDDLFRLKLSKISSQCAMKYDWSEIALQYEKVYLRAMHDSVKKKHINDK